MKKKFKNAFKRVRNLIINPKRYFTKIVADGNMEESMLKAYLYGLLGGCLVLLIGLIGSAELTLGAVFNAIIIVPVLAVTLLFVFGGLLMMVAEITGGERDWEIATKGLASVFFVYPAMLVLSSLAFNCASLWIISILIDAYVLFLFYNISLYCLRGKRANVILVIGILALFIVTLYITDFRTGWLVLKNSQAALMCGV